MKNSDKNVGINMPYTKQRWIVVSGMVKQILACWKHNPVGSYPKLGKFTKWTHLLNQEYYK